MLALGQTLTAKLILRGHDPAVLLVTLRFLLEELLNREIPRYSAANLHASAYCSLLVGVLGFGGSDATSCVKLFLRQALRCRLFQVPAVTCGCKRSTGVWR